MSNEYQLPYTGNEIEEKLEKIDSLDMKIDSVREDCETYVIRLTENGDNTYTVDGTVDWTKINTNIKNGRPVIAVIDNCQNCELIGFTEDENSLLFHGRSLELGVDIGFKDLYVNIGYDGAETFAYAFTSEVLTPDYIDKTLSKSGYVADAAAVGSALDDKVEKVDLDSLKEDTIYTDLTNKYYEIVNGAYMDNEGAHEDEESGWITYAYKLSKITPSGIKCGLYGNSTEVYAVCFQNDSEIISGVKFPSATDSRQDIIVPTIPEDATYMYITTRNISDFYIYDMSNRIDTMEDRINEFQYVDIEVEQTTNYPHHKFRGELTAQTMTASLSISAPTIKATTNITSPKITVSDKITAMDMTVTNTISGHRTVTQYVNAGYTVTAGTYVKAPAIYSGDNLLEPVTHKYVKCYGESGSVTLDIDKVYLFSGQGKISLTITHADKTDPVLSISNVSTLLCIHGQVGDNHEDAAYGKYFYTSGSTLLTSSISSKSSPIYGGYRDPSTNELGNKYTVTVSWTGGTVDLCIL